MLESRRPRLRESLWSLLNRDWFRKIWTLQEAAVARAAYVKCGSKSVSKDIFRVMPAILGIDPGNHRQAVLNLFDSSRIREDETLKTLLARFTENQASEQQDKIYA